jgi:hypothetical protein
MNKIKSFYQNVPNSDIYMKDLNLAKVILDLVSKYQDPNTRNILEVRELALGTKIVLLVEKADQKLLTQLAFESRALRPITPPPDPIAFQQQKSLYTEEEK